MPIVKCAGCNEKLEENRGLLCMTVEGKNGKPEMKLIPAGPMAMRQLCPTCWQGHCAACGVALVDQDKRKPSGKRHYCDDCWRVKEKEYYEVARSYVHKAPVYTGFPRQNQPASLASTDPYDD